MYGIIGGTGLNTLPGFVLEDEVLLSNRYGTPSGAVQLGSVNDTALCFIARHGQPHRIPPHKINYRANLAALKECGVASVIAVNAVGGIHNHLGPGALSVPDQIIDYTHGREHTIYDGSTDSSLDHIDFTEPYTQRLRLALIQAASSAEISVLPWGTYAATNGPRLESAAEVLKIKHDGGDMIGMTGMPEAAIAREMGLEFASIALSVNWAAGLHTMNPITMQDINAALSKGIASVEALLQQLFVNTK